MKRLAVFAGGQLVGHLQESQQYELLFRYALDWLSNPKAIALSANLPLIEQTFTGDDVPLFSKIYCRKAMY